MTTVNHELSLIEQQKQADKIREQTRARAEAEAKKLLHAARNITTYTPAGMLSQNLQQQLQERVKALAEGRKPKTPEERAQTFDVKNAVAHIRSLKGLEAPEFAGETETLPTAEEILGILPADANPGTPLGVSDEGEPGTPLEPPTPEPFDVKAYAQSLVTSGQARSQGHAMDVARREGAKREKRAGK